MAPVFSRFKENPCGKVVTGLGKGSHFSNNDGVNQSKLKRGGSAQYPNSRNGCSENEPPVQMREAVVQKRSTRLRRTMAFTVMPGSSIEVLQVE